MTDDYRFLHRSDHREPSVFQASNMLREARRQLAKPEGSVPPVCLLDPDGDIVSYVKGAGLTRLSTTWACYHTTMHEIDLPSGTIGVVGCAVGAPFAVLVAEEMFASGCQLLMSVTSSGRVSDDIKRSSYVVIDRALRGEGTSQAYLPPSPDVLADPLLVDLACGALINASEPILRGATWTTDAPFRETESALQLAAKGGALAVEMEAAALYSMAQALNVPVICMAHVTNEMAVDHGDFEKGDSNGASTALELIDAIATAWLAQQKGQANG